jgi:hypothetical protein
MASKIIAPDVIRAIIVEESYEKSIQDAIQELKEQPILHKNVYEKFIEQLRLRLAYYENEYNIKHGSNNAANDALMNLLGEDKLSELLERITEFRGTDAEAFLPSITGIFRRRAIYGTIEERITFHKRVHEQTRVVARTSVQCAIASAYYTLFQNLINSIGEYLNRTLHITYVAEQVIETTCMIPDNDAIRPVIQKAEQVVENVEEHAIVTSVDLDEIKIAIENAMNDVPLFNDEMDDELAKKIAVAAVAILMNEFTTYQQNINSFTTN